MSTIHASLDVNDRMVATSVRSPLPAITTLYVATVGLAGDLFARFQHRRTMRRIARFSDHRLHDMGFERDWDGSILPMNPASPAAKTAK